ncbi:MAG TPA: adenylate/guanylate cyclase domain-containing protein [Flavipsychrobacter sp.]|nr:adenylate/guanylate cyclase domain-containing protein [Flavipsychrobacter sp.]
MKGFFLLLIIPFFFFCNSFSKEKWPDTAYINSGTMEKDIVVDNSFTFNNDDSKITWRYKNADDPSYSSLTYNDSGWIRRASSFSYEDIGSDKIGKNVAWFRLRLKADTDFVNKAIALKFKGTGAMEVYLDGRLFHKIGEFDTDGKHDYYSLSSQPGFLSLNDTSVHMLAVRYENTEAKENEETIWGFEFSIDSTNNVFKSTKGSMTVASWFLIGLGTVFLSLFLVHFLMFLFYRKDSSNLYFALFTLCVATLLYGIYISYSSSKPVDVDLVSIVVPTTIILGTTSLSAFIAALFSKRKIFVKIILGLGILTMITSIVDAQSSSNLTSIMVGILLLLSVGYALVMIIIAMVKKMPGAFLLGSGIIFFFVFWIGVTIWGLVAHSLKFNNVLGSLLLLSIVSIPLSISAYLAWRFSATNKNLSKQLTTVEQLSQEKQAILENQNARLEKEVTIRTREIAEEKKRSDDLLLNILPQEVAEELKISGHSKAHRYDEVSVLFTDFVNFTAISEQLGVEELLNELNINFTAFDRIMEKHKLEKIKTIGDAYLAVCGVPVANPDHAKNTVNAALDILDFVQKRRMEVPYGLNIRIGINSGALIAGIIGVKKFAYDIWGDTVNIAARMEQSSDAGKINISANTHSLVKDEFVFTYRGRLQAKGKGEMDMYFVERTI